MIIDSHCHLQDFGSKAGEVWRRSVEAGVTRCVNVGTRLKDCYAALKVARALQGVSFAGGLHPVDAERLPDEWEGIRSLCQLEECVAVGETGLDFFKGPNQSAQVRCLEEQLQLAANLNKPVILHVRPGGRDLASVRRIHDVLFSTLRQHTKAVCVFHCFAGSAREAREAVAMGHYLSFAGTVTFENDTGHMLREAARVVPEDKLMVETDAPYLKPVGCHAKRNDPSFVRLTLGALARARGWTMADAISHTARNAQRVFGL